MALPLFEMKISGRPIAILKTGDRQLQFIKINKINFKYFATKEGIYELDDQYEYRYKKKVSVFFYNFHNSKPISLMAVDEIDNKLKRDGEAMLFNKERYLNTLPPNTDFSQMKIPADETKDMSPDTRRFLQDYELDDEQAKTNLMLNVHHQKVPVAKYSSALIGMGTNRGAYAIIQIGRKRIDIVPMVINNNRAYTKYGVFKTSNEDIYLCKKQVVCFFILSNDDDFPAEPMNRKSYGFMKQLTRKKNWTTLETFHKPMEKDNTVKKNDDGGKDPKDPNITSTLRKKDDPIKSVNISTEKNLLQWAADSPSVFQTTLKEIHASKEIVATKLSDSLKKAIPIVLIFGAVMGIAIVMSNAPPVLDKIAELTGMAPPKIVYLNPDEAMKEGIDVANLPIRPDYDPETLKPWEVPPDPETGTPGMNEPSAPLDVEAPEIFLPDTMEKYADTRDGLIINYVAYGIDNVDGNIKAVCDPESGSWIPLGENIVHCSVTDEAGNETVGSWILIIYGDENIPEPEFPIKLPP